MRNLMAAPIDHIRADLGEGPSWHPSLDRLVWVDIRAGRVLVTSEDADQHEAYAVGQQVSAALPASDGLLSVLPHGVATLERDGSVRPLMSVLPADGDLRLNDAKCDGRGRAYVGSIHRSGSGTNAGVFRLDAGPTATPVVTGMTTANGIAWSPDGSLMYVADTIPGRIDRYSYDADAGLPYDGSMFVSTGSDRPDGLCVDDTGAVWVALHGGGRVERYTPDGRLDTMVELTVSLPTSCAFGGSRGDTLFITTAAARLMLDERVDEPQAGCLFTLRPGVTGPAATLWTGSAP